MKSVVYSCMTRSFAFLFDLWWGSAGPDIGRQARPRVRAVGVLCLVIMVLGGFSSAAGAAFNTLGGESTKGALRITVINGVTVVERHDGSRWRNVTYNDDDTGFAHSNTAFAYPAYNESYGIFGVEPTRGLDFEYDLKSQRKSGDTITTVFEDPGWYELKQEITYSGTGSEYDIRYEVTNLASDGYWFRLLRYHAVSDGVGGVAQGTGFYRSSDDEVGVSLEIDGEAVDYSIQALTPSQRYQAGDIEAVRAGVMDVARNGLNGRVEAGTFDAAYAMQWSSGGVVRGHGGTWVVEFRERFEGWSLVSEPRLAEDDAGNMAFRFDSREILDSSASAIAVSVDGPETAQIHTFDRDDFALSGRNPYTYTLTTRQAFDDGLGTYTARVEQAITEDGRDGADGTAVDTHELQPGSPVAGTSQIRATSPHAANGEDAARVTVHLRDANGHALRSGGDQVRVEVTGSASVSPVTDNRDGSYTATMTRTVAGTVSIGATVNGTTIPTGNPRVEFRAEAAVPEAANSTFSVTSRPVANGNDASVVTVRLRDADGNAITTGGASVEVRATGSAVVSSVTDNNDGSYAARVTNTVAETVRVSAAVNGVAISGDDPQVTFRPDLLANVDASVSTLSVTRPHLADGKDASQVIVRLKDANGNDLAVSGATVEINATGSAVVSAVSDNGDGTYTATITNNVAETVGVTATVNGQRVTTRDHKLRDRQLLFYPCAGWRKNVGQC